MEKLRFLLMPLIVLFAFGIVQAQPTYGASVAWDTLTTSSSLDTSTYTVPVALFSNGLYEYTAIVDSVSGAIGATVEVQTCYVLSTDDDDWGTVATLTINGAGVSYYSRQARSYNRYLRFRTLVPSSTGVFGLKQGFTFRGDNIYIGD